MKRLIIILMLGFIGFMGYSQDDAYATPQEDAETTLVLAKKYANEVDATVITKPDFNSDTDLVDSLETAIDNIGNGDIKELVEDAIEAIKNKPEKGDGVKNWVTWVSGLFTTLQALILVLILKFKEIKAYFTNRKGEGNSV